VLECVLNLSEGRDPGTLAQLAAVAGHDLLDVHTDPDHHRAVFTLVGVEAPRSVTRLAVEILDLRTHEGVHPRFGVVDVVPFVPLAGSNLEDAMAARDAYAEWAADTLGLPCFLYGPERSLPDVRRGAFTTLAPDFGPAAPHPTAGSVAVGARPVLVAYNLWLAGADLALAGSIARALRGPQLRALAFQVGPRVQVSMNLIAPEELGPADAYDLVARHAAIERAELVGLVPNGALHRIDPTRWSQLDLAADRTIEWRVEHRPA
jgi:glutamate formiminotransferase / 5-formyltetrahydrofolate cyclo-ligase